MPTCSWCSMSSPAPASRCGWTAGGVSTRCSVRRTRPHNDLDLVIDHLDADRYRTLMAANGFRVLTSRHNTPRNFVMADAAGREVDVHLVDRRVVVRGDDGVDVYGPNGLEYEVGALDGTGTIAERRVACCTAEFQVRSHTGYDPRCGGRTRRAGPPRTLRHPPAAAVRDWLDPEWVGVGSRP